MSFWALSPSLGWMWEKLRQKNKRKPRKSKWVRIFEYCATFFRWCCLTTTDQVSMTPVPLISPIQFYLKVFTCVKRICIYLPGGPYHKKTSGKMSFFPLKLSTSEKSPQLHLSVRLYTDYHVPVDVFVITPGFCTSQFRHLQPIWVAPVIKTSWLGVEVSCLGYRHAVLLKGHAGFESPFVERSRPIFPTNMGNIPLGSS